MHKLVFRYKLNISFKFKILFVVIFSFILSTTFAQSVNNHHHFIFSNTSKIATQSISRYNDQLQKSSLSHTHAPCATHGHGHCCNHIINDSIEFYAPSTPTNRKDICSQKNLLLTEFIRNFLKPPII